MENIRPEKLSEFVGQERTRQILGILCASAKRQGSSAAHVLLSGPPGLGKTTLARIIAHEMGSRLVETVGGSIQTPEQLIGHLRCLKVRDVLFIDEIHAMPRFIEELLYSAMEDFQVPVTRTDGSDFMKALGVSAEPVVQIVTLPPFTLVGASTMSGLVSAPLRSRFAHSLTLEHYTDADLTQIVLGAAAKLKFPLPENAAAEIARRSRSTARLAIGNLRWVVEFCSGTGVRPDMKAVREAFCMKGIDKNGLTDQDRRYLEILLSAGQPVGLGTLSMALNETVETIEHSLEPHLVRQGLIRRAPRGRVALEKARKVVGDMVTA